MSLIPLERLAQAKRLLFISPLALGDFLYLKTFLAALKWQNPHLEVDIWLDDNRNNQDSWRLSRSKIMLQWITAEPAFSRSYGCCDSKAMQDSQIETAKALNYDLVITHSGSKSEQFSQLARRISPKGFIVTSLAKSKFGGLLDAWFFRHSDKTFKIDVDALGEQHHITDRYYQLLHRITGLTMKKQDFMPSLTIAPEFVQTVKDWLTKQFNASAQGPVYFLNHLSTNKKRDWHQSQLFELIARITEQSPDSRFIVNSTPENYGALKDAIAQEKQLANSHVAVFTVENNFFELPALIAAADRVITVETAIMHFATASQRPLIAMMRQKKPYWAPPETATSKVLYANTGKGYVSDISVNEVMATLAQVQASCLPLSS
ncbi:glycosyltransferase family 9 protein [Shewanella marisflavi]|uniref:glycosyltransferase family 9 protein n=1 Tax=Shewanella marisflavi TaxID=260364 RepID=UPI00200DD220|nr:glycosyltransferase family 9 protein [Shewanella marisflavi]MCL1043353.1 glycosyltransferase family 9 protein [Shewanella marisflavi]